MAGNRKQVYVKHSIAITVAVAQEEGLLHGQNMYKYSGVTCYILLVHISNDCLSISWERECWDACCYE
jgi:hypothetical protein